MKTLAQQTPLEKKLSKAKAALVLEHPFIGSLAMNMPFHLDDSIPTAGTDGKQVRFNPDFIKNMTDEELKFLVAHEIFHPMFEHPYRRFERDPKKWNIACDYVVNEILVQDGIGKMPMNIEMPDGHVINGVQNTGVYNAGGGTTDGVFKLLPDMDDDDNGDGSGDGTTDGSGDGYQDCEDGSGTQAEMDQAAAEMKVLVAQAAQAARMMGKLTTNQAKLVDEVLNPKVDWRDVLQRFVERCRTDRRSFARPNRRFLSQGLYMASPDGEAMGELVFAVDCSGSCWNDIPQFAAEVLTVHEDHKPLKLHIIYFDSEVCHYECFTRDDEMHMEPHGGGGTRFSPVWEYMAEHDIEPMATIFLTDLCCNDFGDTPEHPVLWVCNYERADEPPFGEVVMM